MLGMKDPQSDSGVDSEVSLEDVYFDVVKLREDITHMKTCLETCLNKMISDHIVVSGVESSQELQAITTKLLKAASAAQELLTPDGKETEELQQEETCQEDVCVSTPADEASNDDDDDDDEKLQQKESGQEEEAVTADLPASAAAELQEEAAVSDKMPPKAKKSLWRRFCHALGLREPTEGTKKMMETTSLQRGEEQLPDGENTDWVSAPPAPADEASNEDDEKLPVAASAATEAQEEAVVSENMQPQTETLNLEIRPRKKWLHLLLGAVKKAPADEVSNDDGEKLQGEESSQKIIYVKFPPQVVAMDLQKYDSRQEEAVVFEMVL